MDIYIRYGFLWRMECQKGMDKMKHQDTHWHNEIQMFLKCAKKALQLQIDERPKSGLIVNKGTDQEARMRYVEAMTCIEKLETMFAVSGALSLGICHSCSYMDKRGHSSRHDCIGQCKLNKGKFVHDYNSCAQHSKEGGGYGL